MEKGQRGRKLLGEQIDAIGNRNPVGHECAAIESEWLHDPGATHPKARAKVLTKVHGSKKRGVKRGIC